MKSSVYAVPYVGKIENYVERFQLYMDMHKKGLYSYIFPEYAYHKQY